VLLTLILLIVSGCATTDNIIQPPLENNTQASISDPALSKINLPSNFKISLFAQNLGSPRFMLAKDNIIYAASISQGRIYALPDLNNDSVADSAIVFMDSLDNPHSIDYYDGWYYIGETSKVIRVKSSDQLHADTGTIEELVDMPSGGGHFTRTVKIYNNAMYISIGSSCNVCAENNPWRASIIKCDLDGNNCNAYATGLRNSVGLEFDELTGTLYATDNGRDNLGDNIPPDEINIIQEGKNFGWPYCYGNNAHDNDFDKAEQVSCLDNAPAFVELQAHSAPLGLHYYDSSSFPLEYKGTLFVAFHGSWNRSEPTGYKIVNINLETKKVTDFASGWLQSDGKVIGRPVGIVEYKGALLVSDDDTGKIYRIYYEQT